METFFDLIPILFFLAIFLYSGYLDMMRKLIKKHQKKAKQYTKNAINRIQIIKKEVPNPAAQIWQERVNEDVQSTHPAYAELSEEDRIHNEAIAETEYIEEDEIEAHADHHPLPKLKEPLKRRSRFTNIVINQGEIRRAFILKELLDKPIALRDKW